MPLTEQQITKFQNKILSWYKKNKRGLPWREVPFDTSLQQRDPYKILVSEVMLQQTQVSRVIPKYEEWLKRFPTVESLATAPTRDVLFHWSGLGYNSRALNLQKTAKIIHESRIKKHEARENWPGTFEELIKLPGIGKYTANALLCFAFNQQVAVVDTNIRKVILTQILSDKSQIPNEKEIQQTAEQLLPKGKAYEWNQALMDYAGSVLKDTKITIPRQSPFRTSNRYYRGQTMKLLVRQHTVAFPQLWQKFEKENPIEKERLSKILRKMEEDGLIRLSNEEIAII